MGCSSEFLFKLTATIIMDQFLFLGSAAEAEHGHGQLGSGPSVWKTGGDHDEHGSVDVQPESVERKALWGAGGPRTVGPTIYGPGKGSEELGREW